LLDLHANPQGFLDKLNSIGIPQVQVRLEPSVKCGIRGTFIRVAINGKEEEPGEDGHEHTHDGHTHDGHEHTHAEHTHDGHGHTHAEHVHHHNSFHNIEHLIGHLNVSDNVKQNILAVYKLIAEAESHVHGVSVQQIHFHEVGEMDALADIAGVCLLIEELKPESILASPVNTGSGQVRCSHGVLPVPAPATAYILQNVPIYSDQTRSELCTPTGAALLKHFVNEFCGLPVMTIEKTGYGMGKKNFEKANCVRVFFGNRAIEPGLSGAGSQQAGVVEEVAELVCNLDDMTPEAVAFAQQLLFDEGALDVWTVPIVMKKGRLGVSFHCLCRSELKDKMVSLIFKYTATLGVREHITRRYTLHREQIELQTQFGTVRMKAAYGFGVRKSKPEYEDIAAIAREKGITIQELLKQI
jgi:hypothetical protein